MSLVCENIFVTGEAGERRTVVGQHVFLDFYSLILVTTVMLLSFVVNSIVDNGGSKADDARDNARNGPRSMVPRACTAIMDIKSVVYRSARCRNTGATSNCSFSRFFGRLSPCFGSTSLTINGLRLAFNNARSNS